MTFLAWAAVILTLAGCAAYACAALSGHRHSCLARSAAVRACRLAIPLAWTVGHIRYRARQVRYHRTRRRYARRMTGPLPGRDQGVDYDRRRWLTILDAWEAPAARPERSRT